MPGGIIRSCIGASRYCAYGLITAAVWTSWLVLSLLLVIQLYAASVKELRVPRFVLRAIEDHLAQSGVSVKFGRAIFDPSGRLLLEKASFKLASFSEPVVTAGAIYIRVDPWALFSRRFEPREIRATGTNLFIPAMLSSSGRAETIIQDLDAGFSITSRGNEFSVDYLNCRLGGICVSAHGTINAGTVTSKGGPAAASLPLAEFVAKNYVALSREFSRAEEQMSGLDHAVVTAVLTPSESRGAIVAAEMRAPALRMAGPVSVEAEDIRAAARFPLLGSAPVMMSAAASAKSLRLVGKVSAAGVSVGVRGILKIETLSFDPRQMELTAAAVKGGGAELTCLVARIYPKGGRAFSGHAAAMLFGRPVRADGDADLASGSAEVAFEGSVAPDIVGPLSARLRTDIRRFADLSEPVAIAGRVRYLAGWKFSGATARVDARNFTAYHVGFEEARGVVSFDGSNFAAREAFARSGENEAEGSYEQSFSTKEFRYLLSGRLRPLEISAWFIGNWWTKLFGNFGLPKRPIDATVDVRGRYARTRHFSVFVYSDSRDPVVLGVPLDRLRTLLYVDQTACDGFEVVAARGGGSAQGSFRLSTEPATGRWSGLDLDVTSTLEPAPFAGIFPSAAAEAIRTFSFDSPPLVSASGHIDGPAAAGGRHKSLRIGVRSDAGLRVHGVAFDRASFKLGLDDDEIAIDGVDAGFAGGAASGSALITGTGADRRLKFKASLSGASLGQAAAAAEGYVVSGAPRASTALDTFARDRSGVRLDLNVAADGRMGVAGTFVGNGNFQVQGAKLGEVSLLGGLSKFLKFPELRFTQARAEYKIEDGSLIFPELSVLGANSAIKAKGTYAIDRRQLDFSATIYPFMESKTFLQIFNAISAPLSAVFRVRLTGSIDKPSWSLAYSPFSIIRESELKPEAPEKPATPSPLANPAP